ncbi:MAG: hypothetical protein A3K10_11475 [Bacteroidetes bacterium RIFCSPLOWO2_12_FULL_31_6]|nr:MAG: hypothetical protein A3K10_11475 [Bacteroidetes bacterium RIFCSPLOWO2_12_FULL_31_6]
MTTKGTYFKGNRELDIAVKKDSVFYWLIEIPIFMLLSYILLFIFYYFIPNVVETSLNSWKGRVIVLAFIILTRISYNLLIRKIVWKTYNKYKNGNNN